MTAAGQFLNFRSHIIPASCTYDSSYSLEYNFGQIQKKTDYGESDDDDPTTPDTQSTEGGITFNMNAYTEAARQNLIGVDERIAGETSYVTISPASTGVAGFTFAPTSCKLDEDECDSAGENCVNKNSFVLFDSANAQCTNAGPLGFTIAYDDATSSWNFEFMLFLFNPAEINQYNLKCEVKVCAENQDPASACNAMAASCLDSSQTYYVPCASGTTWDGSGCTVPLVSDRVYIYPQATSRIWGFNLLDDFTWDLHVTIDDYIPDRNEANWYNYANGYIVFNQDSGNVEWFSVGNGVYRQKVVRYNGNTGAFVSESDLAYGTTNSCYPVWTPTHGTVMIHGNGKVSNPTPGAAGPNVAFPDVPSSMSTFHVKAVYKDGKIYRAVGSNNDMFTWLDLSSMTWYAASHSGFSNVQLYAQLICWGDKWINIKGTEIQIFEVDTGSQTINNLIDHTVDLYFGIYNSFAFMKGNTMYAWLRSNLNNHYGRKYMFSADGSTYTQENWHSWSMSDQGFSEDEGYWSTFI